MGKIKYKDMPEEHETFHSAGSESSLLFSEKEIKIKEYHEDSGYGIRVYHNGALGFAYCEEEKEIKNAIIQAKEAARLKIADFSFQNRSVYPKISTVDRNILDLDENRMKEILYKIREGAERFTGSCRIGIDAASAITHIENSNGLDATFEKTYISISAEAMLGKGFGYSYYSSQFLPKDFIAIGEDAGRMAAGMQKTKKPPAGRYVVVFELESLSGMLNVLLPSFSGDWKRRGISLLTDKAGEKIFSEKLCLYEDSIAKASAARPFDDEGTTGRRTALVENGMIKNFLYDLETAALDKGRSTGSCTRADYASGPTIGPSNITICAGEYGNFENELDEFIIVKSLHGTHTSNATTGDFGVEVNAGWHCKKGIKTPIRGFMLSGNIFNLFNSIRGMEKQAGVFDNLISPRIAFEDVSAIS